MGKYFSSFRSWLVSICTFQWHISLIHFRLVKKNAWMEIITKRYLWLTWVTWPSNKKGFFQRRFYEKQWAVLPWPTAYLLQTFLRLPTHFYLLCNSKQGCIRAISHSLYAKKNLSCPDHKRNWYKYNLNYIRECWAFFSRVVKYKLQIYFSLVKTGKYWTVMIT